MKLNEAQRETIDFLASRMMQANSAPPYNHDSYRAYSKALRAFLLETVGAELFAAVDSLRDAWNWYGNATFAEDAQAAINYALAEQLDEVRRVAIRQLETIAEDYPILCDCTYCGSYAQIIETLATGLTLDRPNLTPAALAAWVGYLKSTHRAETTEKPNRPGGKLSDRQLAAAQATTPTKWVQAMNLRNKF